MSKDWRHVQRFARHEGRYSQRTPGYNSFSRTFAAASTTETIDISQEKGSSSLQTSPTVPVILTVNNMKCGGCSAAVKRILLQQPYISGAAVNLLTETAVVQVDTDGDTQAETAAEAAAAALSSKGFPAALRVADGESFAATAAARGEQKKKEIQNSYVIIVLKN